MLDGIIIFMWQLLKYILGIIYKKDQFNTRFST